MVNSHSFLPKHVAEDSTTCQVIESFHFLFVILNGLQGFFIFLLFCLANERARKWWLSCLHLGRKRSRSQGSAPPSSNSSRGQRGRLDSRPTKQTHLSRSTSDSNSLQKGSSLSMVANRNSYDGSPLPADRDSSVAVELPQLTRSSSSQARLIPSATIQSLVAMASVESDEGGQRARTNVQTQSLPNRQISGSSHIVNNTRK